MTINMGPHHPATHGVLRLLVSLEGEVVRDLKPVVGYVHTGIEKNCEDKSYWKVIPFVERMDYLVLLLQHGGVRRLRRAAAGARDPAARPVPAGDPPGAEPDPLAPGLARDLRARPRRDVDVLLLLPRPRPGPRPVRDVDRAADAHPLLPGRRRLRGHPGRLRAQGARVLRRDALADRPVRGDPEPQRDLPAAHQGTSASSRASGCSTWASPARCCAPPASRGTCARSSPRSPTATSTSRSRSARSATATTATGCACRRCASRCGSSSRRIDGPARGAVDRRRPQGRAAAARRALDLDGGADPPLQAGHRGLPGSAGRGLLRRRVAARGARLLRASPTARRSRPGSTSATPRS